MVAVVEFVCQLREGYFEKRLGLYACGYQVVEIMMPYPPAPAPDVVIQYPDFYAVQRFFYQQLLQFAAYIVVVENIIL